jgi:hypothetical protein
MIKTTQKSALATAGLGRVRSGVGDSGKNVGKEKVSVNGHGKPLKFA